MTQLAASLGTELAERLFHGIPNVDPLLEAVQPGITAAFTAGLKAARLEDADALTMLARAVTRPDESAPLYAWVPTDARSHLGLGDKEDAIVAISQRIARL